jgi:hypothetical protein
MSMLMLLISAGSLLAQSDRGTITGTVTDPSGAVLVGASVTATNQATGVTTRTTTTSAGNFTIPLLRGGTYEVSIEQSGFKKFVQAGVILEVGQTVRVDAPLQLGQSTETVNVTAQAGQVQRDTSDRGTIVTGRDVLELPIAGQGEQRNPGFFMILAPGVTGRGTSSGGTSRMMSTTVNGSQSASNEFAVDGAIIGTPSEWAGDFRNIPFPQDVVGEYKVMTLLPPAEIGRTGQGYTSFTIKSGTNQFHGSAYEFVRNEKFDARGFFRPSPPVNKQNEFGATFGGPIRKDKTFFYGWYQGFRLRRAASNSLDTVPTALMKGGNLSNILGGQAVLKGCSGLPLPAAPLPDNRTATPCFDALNRPVYAGAIYDPITTRVVAPGAVDPVTGIATATVNPDGTAATGNWVLRDGFGFNNVTGAPIPGSANIIPAGRIDPVAANMFSYFPDPSLPGQNFGYQANWLTAFRSQNTVNSWGTKVDHAFSDTNRVYGSFMGLRSNNPVGGRYPDPIGEGGINEGQQYIARFSHDWIIRPNLVNHWTAGYNRWAGSSIPSSGVDWPATLGWNGVPQTGPGSVWPGLNIGGLGNTYGNAGQGSNAANTYNLEQSLTWTKGRHTIKTGFSYIKMQENDISTGLQSGYLNFSSGLTSLPDAASAGSAARAWYNDGCAPGGICPGMGMASFLLGLGSTGRAFVYAATNADRMGQYAGYLQDDYKVSSKLTLNLGLRYDLLLPTVSAHDQMSWMDPTTMNTDLGIPGAMVFASSGQRSLAKTYTKAFGPRFGLAYSLNDKTAIRLGYGILYTLGGANRSHRGCCYQQGFNSDNNLATTSNLGFSGLLPAFGFQNAPLYNTAFQTVNPSTNLVDGWPASNFPAPPFIDQNYALAGAPQIIAPGAGRPPDIQNWNVSLQRMMPGGFLLDLGYVGTKGTHLSSRLGTSNYLDSKYLPLQGLIFTDIADPAVQALSLVQSMPIDIATGDHTPFAGFQTLGVPHTLGQALRPFPQYTQLPNFQMRDMMETIGVSSYHSFQMNARKHFSQGLSFLVSYTWSKTLSDAESIFNEFSGFTQDPYNRGAEKSLSINDYPNNLVLSYQYELPFGPGKKFANVGGVAGKVIGGWSIAGIQQYQSGPPILFTMGANPLTPYFGPNGFLARPNTVPGVNKRNGAYDKAYVGYANTAITHNDPLDTKPCTYITCTDKAAVWNGNAWTDAAPFTLGSAPRSDGAARRFAYLNEDISFIKRTSINERVSIEFRADFLNMFNRTVFGNDSGGDQYDSILEGTAIDWGVGSFGRIRSQGNYAREIQFGLKVNF